MAQLVITLMFAALTAFAARAIMRELARPLQQPWLETGFAERAVDLHAPSTGATIDLCTRRNRARVGAMVRQTRRQLPAFAAAA